MRTAVLEGFPARPRFALHFGWGERLDDGRKVVDWVKELPGRWWEPERKCWFVDCAGPNPERKLASAGFDVDCSGQETLDFMTPAARVSKTNPERIWVFPRLCGTEKTLQLLGGAPTWDSDKRVFSVTPADLVRGGDINPFIELNDPTVTAINDWMKRRSESNQADAVKHSRVAVSTGIDVDDPTSEQIDALVEQVGDIPDHFTMDLFPYQRLGALCMAAGRTFNADAPGLGKGSPEWEVVATPGGWVRYGDLKVGDKVLGSSGEPVTIIGVYPRGRIDVYRVTFDDGSQIFTDGEHLWWATPVGCNVPRAIETLDYDLVGSRVDCAGPAQLDDSTVAERRQQLARGVDAQFNVESLGGVFHNGTALLDRHHRTVVSVEYAGKERVVCIAVDASDCLYLANHFIPTHNTRQGLAMVAMSDWRRLLLVVPPVVLTHWARQMEEASIGVVLPPRKKTANMDPDTRWIVVLSSGRKNPGLPDTGVVVVSDSLLASPGRAELRSQLYEWAPDVMLYDESHRAMTWGSSRATAMRDMATQVRLSGGVCAVMTGTPMPSGNPANAAAQLFITGHLDTVFGGHSQYMSEFCYKDWRGNWQPRKRALPKLKKMLESYVMVRRKKRQVLQDLPPVMMVPMIVDVDKKVFRQAHEDVLDKIGEWLDEFEEDKGRPPNVDDIKTWSNAHLEVISPMRVAAGVAKLPAATEFITEWVEANTEADGTVSAPLLVWVHHHDVMDVLRELLRDSLPEGAWGFITGDTSRAERDRLVDGFQNGEVSVLVAGITAASVGITLTRGSDQLFIESDWRPDNMEQALGRQDRIGQENSCVTGRVMVAPGTLDERIQSVLRHKSDLVNRSVGNDEGGPQLWVDTGGDTTTVKVSDIVEGLVAEAIDRRG